MAYVITQACCNDTACVDVCPVDCIRPTADDPEYLTTEQLYIEPETCIDCGACVEACPVDAIFPEEELSEANYKYLQINADYFDKHPLVVDWDSFEPPAPIRVGADKAPLRVAIVGTGPAATYAADHLLERVGRNVEVEMFEKDPTPWGLARGGVSPDHQGTRIITESFETMTRKPAITAHFNVEVGRHISHDELLEHHHAVVYAVGAADDRHLDLPGEDLPGSVAATDFVGWYNAALENAEDTYDLSPARAVIVGNGNVAMDVARMLVMDREALARTDIADHALAALREAAVEEVVVLGRRGPVQSAFTSKELMGLGDLEGVDIIVDPADLELDPHSAALAESPEAPLPLETKMDWLRRFAETAPTPGNKRIVLKFYASPVEIVGDDKVTGITVARTRLEEGEDGRLQAVVTDERETIETGLVLRSIGYRGRPVAGLPFDEVRGVLPNVGGRVIDPDTGDPLTGVYTTGWIKRGPSGFLGTNKKCAGDTVALLGEDVAGGLVDRTVKGRDELAALVTERCPDRVGFDGWALLEKVERDRGAAQDRPRVRSVDRAEMIEIQKGRA